jgi:hypothetical protein
MTEKRILMSCLGLTEITEQEKHQTNGGVVWYVAAAGVATGVWGTMSAVTGLYDLGTTMQKGKKWKK